MLELNDKDLPETLKGDKPVLVDFYATWCPPCKRLAPVLTTLAENLKDSVTVVKVDIDKAPESAVEHNIESVPTLAVFKDGVEVARRAGFATLEVLTAWIKEKTS